MLPFLPTPVLGPHAGFLPSVPDAAVMGPGGSRVERVVSCFSPSGSAAGVKVGGPQLNHGREISASCRRKMGPSGFGWVRVLGREGSGGSLTSSFHQRQVLPRLLIRNHVPVACGLRCLNKGLGTVN